MKLSFPDCERRLITPVLSTSNEHEKGILYSLVPSFISATGPNLNNTFAIPTSLSNEEN
jgi:hypothetical protein